MRGVDKTTRTLLGEPAFRQTPGREGSHCHSNVPSARGPEPSSQPRCGALPDTQARGRSLPPDSGSWTELSEDRPTEALGLDGAVRTGPLWPGAGQSYLRTGLLWSGRRPGANRTRCKHVPSPAKPRGLGGCCAPGRPISGTSCARFPGLGPSSWPSEMWLSWRWTSLQWCPCLGRKARGCPGLIQGPECASLLGRPPPPTAPALSLPALHPAQLPEGQRAQ